MSMDDTPPLRMPDLRVVEVGTLVLHEQHDARRSAPLVERMREQGVLRNPPIVTAIAPDDPRFVVLDGANRATAMGAAGLPHLVVQVVRYGDPGVRLSTWHHALVDVTADRLAETLAGVKGLEWSTTDRRHAHAVLARREAIALIAHGGDHAWTVHGGTDLHSHNLALNAMVDAYRSRTHFHRVAGESLTDARADHPEVTALVVFPHFEPDEILELALSGARLPAGITRHLVAWRALRVNVPLETLADTGRTLADKNRWLDDWVRERIRARRIRFYEEPTVLFDE